MNFSIIAAIDNKRGIGKDNTIPWHLSGDFKHFARVTSHTEDEAKQNAVVMGSKTWESLPESYKPLPGRLNVVLDRREEYPVPEGVLAFNSFDDALNSLEKRTDVERVFIIGGGQVYAEAITREECNELILTEIQKTFSCDTFFPKIPEVYKEVERSEYHKEKEIKYQFVRYTK